MEITIWVITEPGEEDRIATNRRDAYLYAEEKPGRVVNMEKGIVTALSTKLQSGTNNDCEIASES